MRGMLICGGLIIALLGCGAFHWRGAREEERLRLKWLAGGPVTTAASVAATLGDEIAATEKRVAEALNPPEVRKWTAEELEAFLRDWSGKVKAEEKRLIAAGEQPFGKFDAYKTALAGMTPEELLRICYEIPSGTILVGGMVNWESPDEEIRHNLFLQAFQAMRLRFPFLSLQLPPNQLDAKPFSEANRTIRECARIDGMAAWEIVKGKYGGKEAPIMILTGVLEGAAENDFPARMELARKWGILDQVADSWTGWAASTPAGQEAWIAALHETAPADKDSRVMNFIKEVETSEGFEGVKRLVPRLAEKGAPLRDSILREAAGRDLEEGAVPKADWILSETSPGAALDTVETLITTWTAVDPLQASEWLDQVPKTAPWRRAAMLAFAKAIQPHDAEAAALWRKAAE